MALDSLPALIDMKFLRQYDGYRSFIGEIQSDETLASDSDQDRESIQTTPLEQFEVSFSTLRAALAEELQSRLIECSPQFFEHIVVKLLHAMGSGGQFGEGRVTNYSHDGGIDGVINEDKLGLDVVCVQAKRWQGTVKLRAKRNTRLLEDWQFRKSFKKSLSPAQQEKNSRLLTFPSVAPAFFR